MEANMQVLEGAQYRLRVKLTNEAGEQLPPALFRVYAGAFCPGYAPAHFHAERTAEEWVLTMPGLKPGRVPWNWQVIAAEYATGVEWLLAAGEVNVTARHATGSGYVDPGELKITATLDKTTLQMTVQIGESTAACSLAVVAAQNSAKAADANAKLAAGSASYAAEQAQAAETARTQADDSATNAAVSAADAHGRATAADTSAQQAANSASDAAASAELASEHATEAAGCATDAATSSKAAADSASDAATSSKAAADSASDAIQASENADTAAAAAAAAAEAARVTGADQAARAEGYAQQAALENARAWQAAEKAAENAETATTHAADEMVHVTGTEHAHLRRLIAAFPDVAPDAPDVVLPALPDNALPWEVIQAHFAQYAQPACTTAPGHVFASRVPWARFDTASNSWKNNACAIDEAALGVGRKLFDNAGLVHKCSTDTVLGVDDYIGKQWAFYCALCNYETDAHGIKHITAVQGYSLNGADFDPGKNTGAFGPAFWYFCCLEKYQDADGDWLTHDGTENGVPLYQLWGISDRPWHLLDESRRAELAAHGVTEADFSLWPECQIYSEADGGLVQRPYWVHSAYCGGYELQADGTVAMVSKINTVLYKNQSYQALNARYGYAAARGGGACVNGFGMLFDIVKNATKNSQAIHKGMNQNNCGAVKASVSTAEPGYVFPIASKGNFEVGCTVWVWQTASDSTGTAQARSIACQVGRIEAIETRNLLLTDGSTADALCLVLDPGTVEPFTVRTGADNATAIAAAKELSDAGHYCHCFATQGQAMAGETAAVLGKHDGARFSLTSNRHPYRVQLTEYMPGAFICAADTLAVKGNGTQAVEVNGTMYVPTSSEYVIMTAPPAVARISQGSIAQLLAAGYVAVGIAPVKSEYILNEQLAPVYGVAYPVAAGGSGSGSSTGHADQMWQGATPAEFLMGGALNLGDQAGSASVTLIHGPGAAYWDGAARD